MHSKCLNDELMQQLNEDYDKLKPHLIFEGIDSRVKRIDNSLNFFDMKVAAVYNKYNKEIMQVIILLNIRKRRSYS